MMNSDPRKTGALAALFLVALGGHSNAQSARDSAPARTLAHAIVLDDADQAVARLLLDEALPHDLAGSLAELGSSAIPALFSAVAARSIRPPDQPNAEPVALDLPRLRAIVAALDRLPRERLKKYLWEASREELTAPERMTALQMLVDMGTGEDLVLCARLAHPAAGEMRVPDKLQGVFTAATRRILETDERAVRSIERALAATHPSLLRDLIRAVGRLETVEVLDLLAGFVGDEAQIDALVLAESENMAAAGVLASEASRGKILRALRSSNPATSVAAIDVVAAFDEIDAIPELVDLIDGPATVAKRALAALRHLTRANVRSSRDAWQDWLADEEDWWRNKARPRLSSLGVAPAGEVSAFLSAAPKHRLYRRRLADGIVGVLDRDDGDIAVLAAAVLAQLGAREHAERLETVAALAKESHQGPMREAAEALRRPPPAFLHSKRGSRRW